MEKILKKIEEIQKFIENNNAKDSHGRKIGEFDKLCFVQEDLTALVKIVKNELDPEPCPECNCDAGYSNGYCSLCGFRKLNKKGKARR